MKKMLLLAHIEKTSSQENKFLFEPSFLDSLNNRLFILPINTSEVTYSAFFRKRNEFNQNDSTKRETVSQLDITKYHLKDNKNLRRHGFGAGCTLLSSDFFPNTNIVYLSLSHRYLFNKKSNIKLLFLQSTYNSVYNYSKTIKTSQMFSLDIGYDIRFYDNDIWSDSFWNIFFTSGITNITLVSYSTIYHKEADKIIARNKLIQP